MPLTLLLPASLLALSALAATPQTPTPSVPVVQTRDGLPHVFAKLKAHKPVTVAWFGGSITEGAGASNGDETSYRGLVGHWFTTQFPQSHVANVNAAIGGTGSDLGAFRLGRDVLAHKPDLVFVEYAVNDGGAPDAMIDRAMEGIVRQIRTMDPDTDICFVYTFVVGWLPDFAAGHLVHSVQRDELVAAHYGIPSVNVAVPAAEKLNAGTMTSAEFSKDGVHPTDAGYQIYADTLISSLEAQRDAHTRPRRHRMPPPLRPDSLEHARMIGADTITPAAGWSVSDKDTTGRFPHLLVSDTPGATQTVAFSGPILAMFYVLGPDTGAFDYKIDNSAWQTLDPFDVFAKGYARAHYRLLADGLPDTPHTLTLKIRADHNADSQGTWTRIGYLLVNG